MQHTSRTLTAFTLIVGMLALYSPSAFGASEQVAVNNTKSGRTLSIPETAVQVADTVFYLGSAVDPGSTKKADGYLIVHKRGEAKPSGAERGAKTNTCYTYLASGAKWKHVEPWVVNPANDFGMTDASVFTILDNGITKWEDAADGILNNGIGYNILGTGSMTTSPLVADETAPDGSNEVYFGALSDPNTIGITIVWGYFGGAPRNRELLEWDQVYNTNFDWSDTGAPGTMDFDNIATHELGHSVGMGDLYTTGCAEETMYGYASEGETKNRTLNAGDIMGIDKLY